MGGDIEGSGAEEETVKITCYISWNYLEKIQDILLAKQQQQTISANISVSNLGKSWSQKPLVKLKGHEIQDLGKKPVWEEGCKEWNRQITLYTLLKLSKMNLVSNIHKYHRDNLKAT